MKHRITAVCLAAAMVFTASPAYAMAAEGDTDFQDRIESVSAPEEAEAAEEKAEELVAEEAAVQEEEQAEQEQAEDEEKKEEAVDAEADVQEQAQEEPAEAEEIQEVIEDEDGMSESNESMAAAAGWKTENGKKYYYLADGTKAKGITEIGGVKYILDAKTGELLTGFVKVGSNFYYGGNDGIVQTGWKTINGKRYYLMDECFTSYKKEYEGRSLSGFRLIKNDPSDPDKEAVKYYLADDKMESFNEADRGAVVPGVHVINGTEYLIDDMGVAAYGFAEKNGKIYYYTKNGKDSRTGLREIDGKYYYFDSDGSVKTGVFTAGDDVYDADNTTGELLTGWQTINNRKYYFEDSACEGYKKENIGKRLSGFRKIGGNTYYFTEPSMEGYKAADLGMVVKSWKNIAGNRYHFTTQNIMDIGWKSIGGYRYHFTTKGVMDDGWKWISKKRYHFVDGKADKGWKTISGKEYYFYTDFHQQRFGRAVIDGKVCVFNTYGVCISKDSTINDVVTYAKKWVGKIPYASSQNGTDPNDERLLPLKEGRGSDCSWFVFRCLEKWGYLEEHINSFKWGSEPSLYPNATEIGKDISKAKPGDIICYSYGTPRKAQNSHVSIYIGNNQEVHCCAGKGVIISKVTDKSHILNIVRFND